MEKFESKFEAAKIPEFYNFYFDYLRIKKEIAQAKSSIKRKLLTQYLIRWCYTETTRILQPRFKQHNSNYTAKCCPPNSITKLDIR